MRYKVREVALACVMSSGNMVLVSDRMLKLQHKNIRVMCVQVCYTVSKHENVIEILFILFKMYILLHLHNVNLSSNVSETMWSSAS